MEILNNVEIAMVAREIDTEMLQSLVELQDMQLALVGGGIGDTAR